MPVAPPAATVAAVVTEDKPGGEDAAEDEQGAGDDAHPGCGPVTQRRTPRGSCRGGVYGHGAGIGLLGSIKCGSHTSELADPNSANRYA